MKILKADKDKVQVELTKVECDNLISFVQDLMDRKVDISCWDGNPVYADAMGSIKFLMRSINRTER